MKKLLSLVLLFLFFVPFVPTQAITVRVGPNGRYYHRHHPRYYRHGPKRYYVEHGRRIYYEEDELVIPEYLIVDRSRIWDTDDDGAMTILKFENGMIFRVYSKGDSGIRGHWGTIYRNEESGHYRVVINRRVLDAERLD